MPQPTDPFETFLEDLRGFVWNDQRKTGRDWKTLAADANLSYSTIRNFASGETKKPHHLTIQKLLSAMNVRFALFPADAPLQRGEIDLRQYRKYRPK